MRVSDLPCIQFIDRLDVMSTRWNISAPSLGRPIRRTNLNLTLDKFWSIQIVFNYLTTIRFLDTIEQ
jgi:hypothetical protein